MNANNPAVESLHLVLGDEELLMDRAVAQIVARVRAAAPGAEDLPVTKLRTGDASAPELLELLSPSLFHCTSLVPTS